MTMQDQDRDWLDERIAGQNYLPDDGFTAKVMHRLPVQRLDAMEILRRRILILSGFFAVGVGTGMAIMQIGPIAREVKYLASFFSTAEVTQRLTELMRQPGLLYSGAGFVIVLGFASIPFLRRWA